MSSSHTVSVWPNHTDSFFISSILALQPHPNPLFLDDWSLAYSQGLHPSQIFPHQPIPSPSPDMKTGRVSFADAGRHAGASNGGRKILGLSHAFFSLGSEILFLALPIQIPPGPLSRAGGAPVNASGSSSPGCKLPTARVRALLYGAACMEFQSQSSFSVQKFFFSIYLLIGA